MRSDLIEEIRINPKYTQYYMSEFPDGNPKEDSNPIIVKRTLFTNEYMKKLTGRVQQGILPPNCRYIEETSRGNLVIIEEPPAIRTIKVQKFFEREVNDLKSAGVLEEFGYKNFKWDQQKAHKFTLAFPYVVFILAFEKLRLIDGLVFLRTQEMRGMADYLLKAPLSNISNNQRVCFGEANRFDTYSLTQSIQNVIMVWWSAVFNTDYTYNYDAYRGAESELGNYLRWEYLTKQNPLFIYDAKWLRMDLNLGEMLEKIKAEDNLVGKRTMNYRAIADGLTGPTPTGKEVNITKRSRKKLELYHDIANGLYIGDYFLNIGDPFTNSRGEYIFIESFIGFSENGNIKYIMVDKDGKKFTMKLTNKVKNYIAVSNKALRYSNEAVLPANNLKVKTGDILVFKNRDGSQHYGAVDFIRAGRDGRTEIKVGRDYYIAENIVAEKFEMEKPSMYGFELKQGDRYILIRDFRGSSPMTAASLVTYDNYNVSNSTSINFRFTNLSPGLKGGRHTLPLNQGKERSGFGQRLYKESDARPLPGLFRVGKRIYHLSTADSRKTLQEEALAWEIPDLGIAYESNYSLRRPYTGMLSTLIENDVFRLPGFMLDLEFAVGDKVISANWEDPYDMLRVKEIAGFSVVARAGSSNTEDLYFILSDKNGNLSKVKYIYGYGGNVAIGKVRKITNKWGRVSAGTKIIAQEAGYSGFPKKDVNIIIGFIYDTGGDEPLVLCSNGQTIWFNDMMRDFKRVTIKSKQWSKLKHAPIDLSKIKPQAGDLVNGSRDYRSTDGYLMTYVPNQYRSLRAQVMEYFSGYPETFNLDSRFSREYIYECIPNPRLRPAQIEEYGMLPGWPNFHGLFYHSPKSEYNFVNEPGRFLNVQSSTE
jgi:hypothetical protein